MHFGINCTSVLIIYVNQILQYYIAYYDTKLKTSYICLKLVTHKTMRIVRSVYRTTCNAVQNEKG